jgi:hypothetical protein
LKKNPTKFRKDANHQKFEEKENIFHFLSQNKKEMKKMDQK